MCSIGVRQEDLRKCAVSRVLEREARAKKGDAPYWGVVWRCLGLRRDAIWDEDGGCCMVGRM
jgi:hypothetical protein